MRGGLIRPAATDQAQPSGAEEVVVEQLDHLKGFGRYSHVLLVACPAVVRRLLRVPEHCGLTHR